MNGEIVLGIIQCAENCKYQSDGYCLLDKCTAVNSVSGTCPYFIDRLSDNGDRVAEAADADKLN